MSFTKKRFKNVLKPGVNSQVLDLSPDERKVLYDFMEQYDMSRSTAYNRFFRQGYGSGFEEWELHGVRNLIEDFCQKNELPVPLDEELPVFYLEKLEGFRAAFSDYVQPLGISKVTCLYRFKNWNFKPWEMRGIRSIISELCNQSA
jgi:hypothetical protein